MQFYVNKAATYDFTGLLWIDRDKGVMTEWLIRTTIRERNTYTESDNKRERESGDYRERKKQREREAERGREI